jgi:hypothetical protein
LIVWSLVGALKYTDVPVSIGTKNISGNKKAGSGTMPLPAGNQKGMF